MVAPGDAVTAEMVGPAVSRKIHPNSYAITVKQPSSSEMIYAMTKTITIESNEPEVIGVLSGPTLHGESSAELTAGQPAA